MKIQYNFRIEEEDKKELERIAEEESKKGFSIDTAEVTRQAVKDYIKKWYEKE